MSQIHIFKLEANKWVIKTRWFYIFCLTLICLGLHFENILIIDWARFAWVKEPLLSLLALALLFNALLYVISRMIDLETAHKHVSILSFLQIVFEIGLVSLLMYDLPGASHIVPALLFIPIVESIVLFGNIGPLMVSILTGVILNILVVLANSNLLQFLLGQTTQSRLDNLKTTEVFTWSLIFSVIYLVVGSMSSYIAKQIADREEKLEEETANKEVQVNALRNFNRELANGTRELKSKDFELEMANKRLETLEEAKSKFISVTAHQLRTPLSAIKWTFDMILTGKFGEVNDEQKVFLAKGFESTQRMIHIVNDLLHVDQVNTDKIEIKFERVNINSLVESVGFEFTNQAISKEIKFEIKTPSKPLPEIEADQVNLRIVLENLLDNAIKYTLRGGQVTLIISDAKLNSVEAVIEIVVKDSGIGIPESEKSKIFSKFFRATNAIRTEPDGSGIGLFIVKDIVKKHGGSLWYESSPNEGSAFHVTLPLRQKKL